MRLGRHDGRDLGIDRGFPGSHSGSPGDGRSDHENGVPETAVRLVGESGDKIGLVPGEVEDMAVIERSEGGHGRDRLELWEHANQVRDVKGRMAL